MEASTEKYIIAALIAGKIKLEDLSLIGTDTTTPPIFSEDGYFFRKGLEKPIPLDGEIRDRILGAKIKGLISIIVETREDIDQIMKFAIRADKDFPETEKK